jgi:hypothetical protein
MRSLIPLNYDSDPKKCRHQHLKVYPALELHAKVAKFGCTRSLRGGWGRSFFKFFLREIKAEMVKLWKSGNIEWSGLSDLRTVNAFSHFN